MVSYTMSRESDGFCFSSYSFNENILCKLHISLDDAFLACSAVGVALLICKVTKGEK